MRDVADGDLRAWDLETGRLLRTFRHDPPRGVWKCVLSPDGSALVTFEYRTRESDEGLGEGMSLWEVKTGKSRSLAVERIYWAGYTPDGKMLAAIASRAPQPVNRIRLFDVSIGLERRTIALGEKGTALGWVALSPDSKVLAGEVPGPAERLRLKLWDMATGKEVGSFEGEKSGRFVSMTFSADGRTLAMSNGLGCGRGKLFLLDLRTKKGMKSIVLGEKVFVRAPVFSPDGQSVVAISQGPPDGNNAQDPKAEDMPQPRIHLIEAASGRVCETIIAPQGIAVSACFSPDGRTLATGGNGRVLLWDVKR
jgi:WD40 repeat protein